MRRCAAAMLGARRSSAALTFALIVGDLGCPHRPLELVHNLRGCHLYTSEARDCAPLDSMPIVCGPVLLPSYFDAALSILLFAPFVHVPAATVCAPPPSVELPFSSAFAFRETSQVMAATVYVVAPENLRGSRTW